MARLTINESADGYSDSVTLTADDFTVAAGNTTTVVSIPVTAGMVIAGAALIVDTAFAGVGAATFKVGTDSGSGTNDSEGLIEAIAVNATGIRAVNTGDELDNTTKNRTVVTGTGNIIVTASTAIGGVATAGKARLLLDIKRVA